MEQEEARRAIGQISVNAQKIAEDMRNLTGQATDERGLVTVTCGVGGRLVDISFDARSRRLDTIELREVILATAERAAQVVQEQFTGLMGQITESTASLGDLTARANTRLAEFQRLAAEQQERLEEIRDSLTPEPMSEPVELRCQRGLWLIGATLVPRRFTVAAPVDQARNKRDAQRTAVWYVIIVAIAVLIGMLLVLAAGPTAPWLYYVLPLLLVAIPVGAVLLVLPGGLWYAAGAGHPVLQVVDGELRARVRPIRRDELPDLGPGQPTWWDLRLPMTSVLGVRIARSDHRPWLWCLALDVPTDVATELAVGPGMATLCEGLVRRAGTPVAWPAGAMLPRWRRRAEVRRLAAELDRARTGVR